MRRTILAFALALVLSETATIAIAAPPSHGWQIGPIIRGRNYSQGMPLTPAPARSGWYFDFPGPDVSAGHVHYVTFEPVSLMGMSKVVYRYRVEARQDTRFVPQESPERPATVSLVLQRGGDNWSGKGRFEFYRWYAPSATVREIAPGEREVTVSLRDPQWTSVQGRPVATNPMAFEAALAGAGRIGLVFGSSAARGHGVYATKPARFTLLDFRIV